MFMNKSWKSSEKYHHKEFDIHFQNQFAINWQTQDLIWKNMEKPQDLINSTKIFSEANALTSAFTQDVLNFTVMLFYIWKSICEEVFKALEGQFSQLKYLTTIYYWSI